MFMEIQALAEKYSMLELMDGFNADLVNILLQNHIESIKRAVDYDTTLDLLSTAIASHIGISVDIEHFISCQKDRSKLYEIFTAWKSQLLRNCTA
jgi:hypothetical protein